MQGKYDRVNILVEAGMHILATDLITWSDPFPFDADQCRNILRAGVQAALVGKSAQFYAAQWIAQCYLLKPDLPLMKMLTKLDAFCTSAASFDDETIARAQLA